MNPKLGMETRLIEGGDTARYPHTKCSNFWKTFAASPPVFTIADMNRNEVKIACWRQPEG